MKIASAFIFQRIQRTITEQTIERLPFRDLMAGKIFALLITKKGIPFIGPAGLF